MRILVLLGASLVAAAPGVTLPAAGHLTTRLVLAQGRGDYGVPYGEAKAQQQQPFLPGINYPLHHMPEYHGPGQFEPNLSHEMAPAAGMGHNLDPSQVDLAHGLGPNMALDHVGLGPSPGPGQGPEQGPGYGPASPNQGVGQDPGAGQWKKKLTWKSEQRQEWKTVSKVVKDKPEWRQVKVEHCEPTQVQVYKDVQVPEWKSVKKPVWKDVTVQAWKQTLVPEWKTIKIPEWKEIEMPAWKDQTVTEDKKVWVPQWSEEWVPDQTNPYGGAWSRKMMWKQVWQKEYRTEKKRIWVKEKRPVWREESLKINKVEGKQLVWVPDKKLEWRDEMVQGWRTEQRPIWVQEKRCEWRDEWKQVVPNKVVHEQVPEYKTVWRPVWENVWVPAASAPQHQGVH